MAQGFLQVAIPVLYVYDRDAVPTEPPGFDMNLLPVISRALKQRAGTTQVTVITGTPTTPEEVDRAFTHLALQYPELRKATAEAANLIVAEFISDHFDGAAVLEHLQRIVEQQRKAEEEARAVRLIETGKRADRDRSPKAARGTDTDDALPGDEEPGPGHPRDDDAAADG